MFDKFGEFDSFSEINELAENLLNEGDIESLKVVARKQATEKDGMRSFKRYSMSTTG